MASSIDHFVFAKCKRKKRENVNQFEAQIPEDIIHCTWLICNKGALFMWYREAFGMFTLMRLSLCHQQKWQFLFSCMSEKLIVLFGCIFVVAVTWINGCPSQVSEGFLHMEGFKTETIGLIIIIADWRHLTRLHCKSISI